ncbi:hypothetical protein Aperf_G00000029878 [Anoplocephala perfoliata]
MSSSLASPPITCRVILERSIKHLYERNVATPVFMRIVSTGRARVGGIRRSLTPPPPTLPPLRSISSQQPRCYDEGSIHVGHLNSPYRNPSYGYSDSTTSETDSSLELSSTDCCHSSQLPFSAQNISINFYSFSSAWNTMNFNQYPQYTTQISNSNIHCPVLFDRQIPPPEPPLPELSPRSELQTRRSIHRDRRRKKSNCQKWEIDDDILPEPTIFDRLDKWIDGNAKRVYRVDTSGRKNKCLQTGWAMRNSNNHKKNILKKSCLGIFRCNKDVCGTIVFPAISDSPRRSQISCPKKNCGGRLDYQSCKGNNGHPVTHSWRRVGDILYLEVKGTHDHPRPQCKALRQRSILPVTQDSLSSETEVTSAQSTLSSSSTNFPTVTPCQYSIPPSFENQISPNILFPQTSTFAAETSNSSSDNSLYQQTMNSYTQNSYANGYLLHPSRSSGTFPSDNSMSESTVPQRSSDSPSLREPWYFCHNSLPFYNSCCAQNQNFSNYSSAPHGVHLQSPYL